jgi:hypothetical protein
MNDIQLFQLRAGLPKAQLKPFNTTPLHGLGLEVEPNLSGKMFSGLTMLAEDIGSVFGASTKAEDYSKPFEALGLKEAVDSGKITNPNAMPFSQYFGMWKQAYKNSQIPSLPKNLQMPLPWLWNYEYNNATLMAGADTAVNETKKRLATYIQSIASGNPPITNQQGSRSNVGLYVGMGVLTVVGIGLTLYLNNQK